MPARELSCRPLCGVCGRPVERLVEDDDGLRLTLTAYCHGEREYVHLDSREAGGSLTLGTAFASGARRLTR